MIINPADNHTRRYLQNEVVYRFNYLWTDPNNIAYLMDAIAAWFLLQNSVSVKRKFMVLLLCAMVMAATVSNGGLIMLIIMLVYLISSSVLSKMRHPSVKRKSFVFVMLLLLFMSIVLVTTDIVDQIHLNYIRPLLERFSFYLKMGNLSGGRLNDLQMALKESFDPMFFFIGSGLEGFTSENGHLYLICMYGFPAYVGMMWLMFKKSIHKRWLEYCWILPIFVCFTMNIGIGEFKWMGIVLLMQAYERYGNAGLAYNDMRSGR